MATAGYVTLDQAKAHLNIVTAAGDPRDADIQLKLDAAEAAIVNHLNTAVDAAWTAETVPLMVTAAILIYLAFLYGPSGRGDAVTPASDPWPTIERLLVTIRTSALA